MRWDVVLRRWSRRATQSTRSLAGQMLVLTVLVAIAVDAALLPPSLGNFYENWLRNRIERAYSAALTFSETGGAAADLLRVAGASDVVLHRPDGTKVRLSAAVPPDTPVRVVDLRTIGALRPMGEGISVLLRRRREQLRVIAEPYGTEGILVEAVLPEGSLKSDISWHARRALTETLVASALIGACLYFALLVLVVRRIRRMTGAIEAFGKRPEDATIPTPPVALDDELGRAESALGRMREEVRTALQQKERLAGLGAAVAKIAHDLRNNLAAAQLVSERLADSDDPRVRQSAPRLERAIARAIALAEAAVRFGRPDERKPVPQRVELAHALDEAADQALARYPAVAWTNGAPPLAVRADPENLHRILVNLICNAAEAMRETAEARISAHAAATGEVVAIDIVDTGPGVAPEVRDKLFRPFAAAQRDGGVGLGLAIARELARAMGGEVALVESAAGATFRVTLPSA